MPQKITSQAEADKALERAANLLKGLRPPNPDTLSDEERLRMFRKLLEPEPKVMKFDSGKDEEGNDLSSEVPLPPHPYPFKNPNAMTPELAEAVRDIRSYAPGAGTAKQSTLTNIPPIGYISKRANLAGLGGEVLKGDIDPTVISLLGMAPIEENSKEYGNKVYINPLSSIMGKDVGGTSGVVAHELSHRNIPPTDDDPEGGFSWKPSAKYVNDLYSSIKRHEKNKRY